mgnify:CR=1 FL=1
MIFSPNSDLTVNGTTVNFSVVVIGFDLFIAFKIAIARSNEQIMTMGNT